MARGIARRGLAMREGEELLSRGDRGNPLGALRLVSRIGDDPAGQYDGREIRLGHKRAADELHHDQCVERIAAQSAVGFAKGDAGEAQIGDLLPDVARKTLRRSDARTPLLEGVLVAQEAPHGVLQQHALLGEAEIHGRIAPITPGSSGR